MELEAAVGLERQKNRERKKNPGSREGISSRRKRGKGLNLNEEIVSLLLVLLPLSRVVAPSSSFGKGEWEGERGRKGIRLKKGKRRRV